MNWKHRIILPIIKLVFLGFSLKYYFHGNSDNALYLAIMILVIDDAYRERIDIK